MTRAVHAVGGTAPRAVALILSLTVLLPACHGGKGGMGHRHAGPVPVNVAKAAVRTTPIDLRAIGTVEAFSTVSIRPRVSGIVDSVRFKEGDDVKAGDVLFTLDRSSYRVARDQAAARLAKDSVLAKNATDELDRNQKLLAKGLVTHSEFDRVRAAALSQQATLKVDQAQVEQARLELSWCTIKAPVSGRTGRLLVHEGNLVSSGGSSQPLVTINQVEPVFVTFSVPESSLDEVRAHFGKGDPLKVVAESPGAKAKHEGTLAFIDNQVDQTTGTVLLKAKFANEDRALWPGQFVNVVLTLAARPDSVVVPEQAVQTGQQGDFVFVVKKDESVESRPVKVGAHLTGEVVIDAGLRGGETVVTDGQLRLVPGSKVEVKAAPKPSGGDAS